MRILFLIFLSGMLINCTGLSDAGKVLRNEKIRTTDEFLVKKREPLILPPDYSNIPVPGSSSKNQQEENKKEKIKKILNAPSDKKIIKQRSTSTEDSILKSIKE